MSAKRYVARQPQVAARRLGDEMLVMSGKDATLFTLNEIAAIIWEAADGATPLDEIVHGRICPQFDVAPDIALHDAERLTESLAERGILLFSDEPIHSAPPRGVSK